MHRNDDHEGHKVKPALVKTLKDLGLDYIDLFLVQTDQRCRAFCYCLALFDIWPFDEDI